MGVRYLRVSPDLIFNMLKLQKEKTLRLHSCHLPIDTKLIDIELDTDVGVYQDSHEIKLIMESKEFLNKEIEEHEDVHCFCQIEGPICTDKVKADFVEKGADLEHDRWAKWQKYMFSKCEINGDGTLTIPEWAVQHWTRQINTKYKDLTEKEKEMDRIEARSYIPLLKEALESYDNIFDDTNKEFEAVQFKCTKCENWMLFGRRVDNEHGRAISIRCEQCNTDIMMMNSCKKD